MRIWYREIFHLVVQMSNCNFADSSETVVHRVKFEEKGYNDLSLLIKLKTWLKVIHIILTVVEVVASCWRLTSHDIYKWRISPKCAYIMRFPWMQLLRIMHPTSVFPVTYTPWSLFVDGLVQERRNCSALAMESHLSSFNASTLCSFSSALLHISIYYIYVKRSETSQHNIVICSFVISHVLFSACACKL